MPDFVFTNLAQGANAIGPYLAREFGLIGSARGNDFVVRGAPSPPNRPVRRKLLTLDHQRELLPGEEQTLAERLLSVGSKQLREERPPPPKGASGIRASAGLLSEVAIALDGLALKHRDAEAAAHVAGTVIPLMRDKLLARYVTGVGLDAEAFQTHISHAKIMLLTSRFGLARAESAVLQDKALSTTLPLAFAALGYVDVLTRFSPLAFTLPVHYFDCTWHFQSAAMWDFDRVQANGLVPEFMQRLSPQTDESHLLGLRGLAKMDHNTVWRLLRLLVESVDAFLGWLVDPRHFVDPAKNEVLLLRQVQAHSAIHLLFADLAAMNYSTDAHSRVSFATAAIDKFANLRVQVGGAAEREGVAFQRLCSTSQRDELTRIIGSQCDAYGYADLKDMLCGIVTRSYEAISDELGSQSSAAANSETERLSRLWSQRNLRHGAFLQQERFEHLYLESHGSVPSTIASLPYLMMLGLLFDPAQFLTFKPAIAP